MYIETTDISYDPYWGRYMTVVIQGTEMVYIALVNGRCCVVRVCYCTNCHRVFTVYLDLSGVEDGFYDAPCPKCNFAVLHVLQERD